MEMQIEWTFVEEDKWLADVLTDLLEDIVLPGKKNSISVPLRWYIDHLLVGDGEVLECSLQHSLVHGLPEIMCHMPVHAV